MVDAGISDFLNFATLDWVIAVASIFLTRGKRKADSALLVTVVASFGFAVAFYLQRRGWAYHSDPMVATFLLAMGYAMTAVDMSSRLAVSI